MFKNIYYQFLLLVSFILVSCTYMPNPAKSPISTTKRHNHWESISQLSHYQTYGAFTYISSKQKIYTRFKWQQLSKKHYRLLLISPIGLTELDLTVQPPDIAQFINKQGKRYVCNNPESMIIQLTGLDIPLNNLQQWIIGLPGEATDLTLDNHGYLKTLNYQRHGKSWTVNYQDYHNDTVPVLPATFELRQGDNLIKLTIYSWNI